MSTVQQLGLTTEDLLNLNFSALDPALLTNGTFIIVYNFLKTRKCVISDVLPDIVKKLAALDDINFPAFFRKLKRRLETAQQKRGDVRKAFLAENFEIPVNEQKQPLLKPEISHAETIGKELGYKELFEHEKLEKEKLESKLS